MILSVNFMKHIKIVVMKMISHMKISKRLHRFTAPRGCFSAVFFFPASDHYHIYYFDYFHEYEIMKSLWAIRCGCFVRSICFYNRKDLNGYV